MTAPQIEFAEQSLLHASLMLRRSSRLRPEGLLVYGLAWVLLRSSLPHSRMCRPGQLRTFEGLARLDNMPKPQKMVWGYKLLSVKADVDDRIVGATN